MKYFIYTATLLLALSSGIQALAVIPSDTQARELSTHDEQSEIKAANAANVYLATPSDSIRQRLGNLLGGIPRTADGRVQLKGSTGVTNDNGNESSGGDISVSANARDEEDTSGAPGM